MGQFDSMGLKPVGEIGLSDPKKRSSTLDRNENKKKDKPKTATAGGGAYPPSKPPKGPTGPRNPDKGSDSGDNEKKKYSGGLGKNKISKGDNPRDTFKRKK